MRGRRWKCFGSTGKGVVALLAILAFLGAPGNTAAARPGSLLDVTLGELYFFQHMGRSGTYPDGVTGFSAATTACNTGDVNVPWNGPMAETHPFIGLAMFRLQDDVLEMIGKNWMKHGYYALSFDQCDLGCDASDGSYLGVGCSDTYTVSHNANRYYLGPREEINPYTGAWKACGSFFDAEPVDCIRDYNGAEPNGSAHRLEVHDSDLGRLNGDGSDARYFYEGMYVVADDDLPQNNIGWRECVPVWTGGTWFAPTIGAGNEPLPGAAILTWGDMHDVKTVAPDDGEVILASQVTDLGGGQWHYEYALYNRNSARRIRAFEVPLGNANAWGAGFHDPDQDDTNDWAVTIAGGRIAWSTDDFATNPGAPALAYQTLFNFRFDADRPPVTTSVLASIFEPGVGTAVYLGAHGPSAGATAVSPGEERMTRLALAGPNPFRGGTALTFTLERATPVRLRVLDVSGRTVRVLWAGDSPPGRSEVVWDGRDGAGEAVASGTYFFRIEAGGRSRTVRGTRLR